MSALKRGRIVVPVDFSEASQHALRVAQELGGVESKLHVLHVLPPLEAISPAVVWGDLTDDNRMESVREFAQGFLDEQNATGAALEIRIGSPGHETTQFADEVNADLIVVSSHGYHGMKRFVLGSVAESIIRHAHCPVLVLRRPDAE